MSEPLAPGDEYRVFTPDRSWAIARVLLQSWYAPAMRLRVYGRDRIPATGAAVVASNHIAGIDPFVLGMSSPRTLRYMAKVELWSIPVVRRVLPHTGTFPVRRGEADREAITSARRVLRSGGLLGIFVEGTRQETGEIGDARTGAAMLAIAEGAPILPVCIAGTDRQKRNPFHPATVAWGTPMDVSGMRRGARSYRIVATAIEDELRRLRAFAHAVDASGRPRDAVPPESLPLQERIDEPS